MRAALCVVLLTALAATQSSVPIFTDITEQAGIRFEHDPATSGTYHFPEVMGSGCAFLDYDNDGRLDIYLIKGAKQGNKLYRQQPDKTFSDVTAESGVAGTDYGMGIAVGDIDNDGDVDLYLSNVGPDTLYRNNGNGTFTDISKTARISNPPWSTSAAFLDYDRDGFLDLYVANYVKIDPLVVCTDRAGRRDYCGPESYAPEHDVLYRNNGDGTFRDVSQAAGVAAYAFRGLGVAPADYNNDGWMDIYVANDREANNLFINQRNGRFQDQGVLRGVAFNLMGRPEASMGVAAGDVENDGDHDLFLTHLRDETNTFYSNRGDQGFQDDTAISGLGGASLPYTGFATGFFDFDHDGDLDIAVANGRVIRGVLLMQSKQRRFWDDYAEPNLLFENTGNARFRNAGTRAGSFTLSIENSRGLAFGDADNDGDIDLLLTNCGGPARLYRNDLQPKGHWLIVRALDAARKRDAVGAVVTVQTNQPAMTLTRVVMPAYGYLSSNDSRVHFGLGVAKEITSVTVQWPNGSTQNFPPPPIDSLVTLTAENAK